MVIDLGCQGVRLIAQTQPALELGPTVRKLRKPWVLTGFAPVRNTGNCISGRVSAAGVVPNGGII